MTIEKQQNDFLLNYDFKLFTFDKGFEIDGVSNEEDCELNIIDNNNLDNQLSISYESRMIEIYLNGEKIKEFDFCENFEEIVWEIHKELSK